MKSPEQRFRSNVLVEYGMPEGCHIWMGGKFNSGYGASGMNGKTVGTHRISYELYNGDIPEGLVVMHSCDNRVCVNPAHLTVGTQADNVRDAVSKNRLIKNKSHCINGHAFNWSNTYVGSRKERRCRKCNSEYQAKYRKRNSL